MFLTNQTFPAPHTPSYQGIAKNTFSDKDSKSVLNDIFETSGKNCEVEPVH